MMKLKILRHNAGMSRKQLETKSGVSARLIKSYEDETRDINCAKAITLYKLAQALDVKMEDLIDPDKQ